ncbi:MAG: serine hydrolase [Gemmatimonadetes bacterium]|nr:serine hydrolase [Gemmatimonadota bacterium]
MPLQKTIALLSSIALTTGTGLAQEPKVDADLETKITAIVAPYVAAGDFQGVVAVQVDGQEPLISPHGLASVELEVLHRPTDIFMIGSVSKQFTAAAILLLEEDGALRTDDPVSRHLPGFPHGDSISIEQLVTHTSGVADIYSLERFGETAGQQGSFEEVIEALGDMPLTHAPGSTFLYSNGGYALLAVIIEQVAGTSYGEFLAGRIFTPLGMLSTADTGPEAAVQGRVPGYDPWRTVAVTPVKTISWAYMAGSGSLWSSAADLLTWTSALHGGRVLNERSYEKFTRDYGYGYGYGVSVFTRFGRDVVGHDGRVAGYSSDLARYVDDGVTIAILSNVQSVVRDEIRRLVAAALFGEPYEIPEQRVFLEVSPVPLEELVGVYSFGPGFLVSISESDGRLLARANEGGYSELIPVNETEWFSRMLYATVRFARDDAGSIDRLIWGLGEQAPVGQRVQ